MECIVRDDAALTWSMHSKSLQIMSPPPETERLRQICFSEFRKNGMCPYFISILSRGIYFSESTKNGWNSTLIDSRREMSVLHFLSQIIPVVFEGTIFNFINKVTIARLMHKSDICSLYAS